MKHDEYYIIYGSVIMGLGFMLGAVMVVIAAFTALPDIIVVETSTSPDVPTSTPNESDTYQTR